MVSYWETFIDGKQSKLSNILYILCLALSNIEGKNFIWLSSDKGILNECGLHRLQKRMFLAIVCHLPYSISNL
jgi:hypothetical protein